MNPIKTFLSIFRSKNTAVSSLTAAICLLAGAGKAADGTWTNNGSSNWSTTGSWSGGTVANGTGFTANFSTVNITANRTITLDSARTIGNLTFGDATTPNFNWTLSGANTLTLDATGTAQSVINVVNQTATISLVLDDTANDGLNKTGVGTLVLSGTNLYSGPTTISAGVLSMQSADALGAVTSGTTVQSGAALEITGTITSADEALTLNGTGISNGGALRNTALNNRYAGLVTLASASRINSDSGTLTFNRTGGGVQTAITATNIDLTFGGAGDILMTDIIATGTGAVTKDGAGNLTYSNANTYTGLTTVSAGSLILGNNNTISTGGVTVDGSTAILSVNTRTDSVGTVTVANGGSITGTTGALTSTGTFEMQSGSVTAELAGTSIPLNKTTAGTVTLSGANTYTGLTTVSAGTLAYGASNAISTGAVTVDGATAVLSLATFSDTVGTVTVANGGSITSSTGVLTTTGTYEMKDGSVSAILAGAVALNKTTTGTVTLSGVNTYSGATAISAGALRIQNAAALGTTAGATTVSAGAALEIQGTITTNAEGLTLNGTGVSSGGALRNTANSNTYAGAITLASASRINSDSGTLTLNVAAGNAISGATFGVTFGGAGNITVSDPIATTTGTLTKDGAGTLTLSGANTYTGLTTVSDGSLVLGANNVIATGGVTVDGAAAILSVNTRTESVGTVTVDNGGSITGTTGTLTSTSTFEMKDGSVTAILAGTNIPLNKTTAGTVTLSGVNTYTGLTTVSAGTLAYGASNVISTGAVTVNGATAVLSMNTRSDTVGTVTVAGGGSITSSTGILTTTGTYEMQDGSVSAILAGAVPLNKTTAGTITLSGVNTYSGATTISAGTLAISAANNLGATTGLTFNTSGGTLHATGNMTISQTIAQNAAARYDVDATKTLILGGAISGASQLHKDGAGTLILNTASSYSGKTNVNQGILRLGVDNAIAGPNMDIIGGTFDLNSHVQSMGVVSSTVTLGDATTAGSITGPGTLTVAAGGGGFAVRNGTVSGTLAGTAGLTKTTAQTVTLSAGNTYSGVTTISDGTLEVTANNALGTTAGNTVIASGAVLKFTGVNYTTPEAVTINGTGIGGSGAIVNSGSSSFAGPITIASNATINTGGGTLNITGGLVKNGTTLTLAGGGLVNISSTGISGSAANSDLVIDGTTVKVSVASTYNGPTSVQNSGVLVFSNSTGSATGTGTVTVDTSSTLSGTGKIDAGLNNFIIINGTLQVGDSTLLTPVASNLTLTTSGTGDILVGSNGFLVMDLFSGAGAGDNSGTATAADYIKLFGTLTPSASSTLVINNPTGMTGFAAGDTWKLFDISGSITSDLVVDYSALGLTGALTGEFDRTTGNFAIVSTPEPSRALLLALGATGLMVRRRRNAKVAQA